MTNLKGKKGGAGNEQAGNATSLQRALRQDAYPIASYHSNLLSALF